MNKIEIEDFEGPIELLLTLVQQQEISLTRINLIDVLDQIINGLEADNDLNESGDIIMIISTLLELKSKLLLPGEVNISEEIQALKEDLLAKILVQRRLTQVLDALENRLQRRDKRHGRPTQLDHVEEIILPIERQNPFVLFTSLSSMMEKVRQDSYRVEYNILPIEHYFDWLTRLVSGNNFSLLDMASRRKDRLDVSGVLIAVLEMVRQGKLGIKEQEHDVIFYWKKDDKGLWSEAMLNAQN